MPTPGPRTQLTHHPADEVLARALAEGNLSLFLGAGVSIGSDLPTWNHLVTSVYMSSLSEDSPGKAITRAYRNYLRAIADWQLRRSSEPLQITAEKARLAFSGDSNDFVDLLHRLLYASMTGPYSDPSPPHQIEQALDKNATLMAVANLCETSPAGHARRVITYNYDDLLEEELRRRGVTVSTIWKHSQHGGQLPVYHVHGLIRLARKGPHSSAGEIVFTEGQYHRSTYDPYSWSNLVQLNTMAEYVGLSVGLSLDDPNMRRLLAAASQTPRPPRVYALLVKPKKPSLGKRDQEAIHRGAKTHLERFTKNSRLKNRKNRFAQVQAIVNAVHVRNEQMQVATLHSLGVTPIWVDSVRDVPRRLKNIRNLAQA